MSEIIDIASLPEHIQDQIRATQVEPPPLFPIAPREFTSDNFQTKEQVELGKIADKLIEAVNILYYNQESWTTGPIESSPQKSETSTPSPKK